MQFFNNFFNQDFFVNSSNSKQITNLEISTQQSLLEKKIQNNIYLFKSNYSVLINRGIMQKGKRNMCGSARSARHRERNKETLLLEWQKSGARGRGSVISLLPDHHRSPRRSNWVRKEGTSSANTSLAMPSSPSTPSHPRSCPLAKFMA